MPPMRPEPFALVAVACFAIGAALFLTVPRPLEAALYAAIAAVLGGFATGIAVGLLDPGVPDLDYTAVGSVTIAVSFLVLAALAGRPASGYLTALFGGIGAVLVGLDSGLKRA